MAAHAHSTDQSNSKLTRRTVFAGLAGLTVSAAPPAIAEMTALARRDFHLAEFKRAAQELDPAIEHWHVVMAEDENRGCSLVVTAFRRTGRYMGDGVYEGSSPSAVSGKPTLYRVRLLDRRIDGQRAFDVRTDMDRMTLPESRFNTWIGKKVA